MANAEYNGIKVPNARVGDKILPFHTVDIPNYEDGLVAGIREEVQSGTRVVVVGGGWGVSTVAASQQVGSTGQVYVFEGFEKAIKDVRSTVAVNNVGSRVNTCHAIVAQANSLRGDSAGADIISPDDIPKCDVLVLDCEGVELEILNGLSVNPRTIIVETHGMLDAPTRAVKDVLLRKGYNIVNQDVAESRLREYCKENDICVLLAKYEC